MTDPNKIPTLTDIEDSKKAMDDIQSFTYSTDLSFIDSKNVSRITTKGLEAQYIQTAINDGVWAAGQTFTAYNQYMVFSENAYKPKSSTPLPHVVGTTPDLDKVEPVDTGAIQGRLNPATLSDWQNDLSAQLGDIVTTAEYSAGNGGGGTGQVIASGTENGANIVKHNTLPLSWELRLNGIMNVSQFGATGDGVTNDTAAIASAFDNLAEGDELEITNGKVFVVDPDDIKTYTGEIGDVLSLFFISKSRVRIFGNGQIKTIRGVVSASDLITIKGGLSDVVVDGLRCIGPALPSLSEDYNTPPGFVVTAIVTGEFGSTGNGHTVKNCIIENSHFTPINFTATGGVNRSYTSLSIRDNKLRFIRGHGIAGRSCQGAEIINNQISEVRRFDATFIGTGIDMSTLTERSVISGNILDKTPYGMKIENESTTVVQSEFNIISNNIITNVGHPDTKPDNLQFALKINSSKTIVSNNIIDKVYGPNSTVKGILVNRINSDCIVEGNIIIGSPCGISDLPFRAITGGPITPDTRSRVIIRNNLIEGSTEVSTPRNAIEISYDRETVSGNTVVGQWENGILATDQFDDKQTDVIIKDNTINVDVGSNINIRNNLIDWVFDNNKIGGDVLIPTTVDGFSFRDNNVKGRVTFSSVGPSSLPVVRDTRNLVVSGNTCSQVRFGSVPSGVVSTGVRCIGNTVDKSLEPSSTTGVFIIQGFAGDEADFAPFPIESNFSIGYDISIEMPLDSFGFLIRNNISDGSLSQPINWYDSQDVDIYSNIPSVYKKIGLFAERPVSASTKRLPDGTTFISTDVFNIYEYQRGAAFANDAWAQIT